MLTNSIAMNKFLYFVLFIIVGCQNVKDTKNSSLLNDNLYKLHNVKQIGFPDNTNTYIALDSIQKDILFKPFLESDLKAISFGFDAYFVAKQEKIYSLTPIIVDISGTDYSAQWLMLIDSKFVTVSKMELGHQESGPRFTTDTTYTLWPENISYFSNDTIKTISVIKTERNQSPSDLIVDSIICIKKILSNGKILAIRSDSLRIRKQNH